MFKIIFRLPTNLRNVQLTRFCGFIFVVCWIRTYKVSGDRKIRQFFASFFHISKGRKTALQLHRTETLKPGKKKCSRHLIYARACVNKDFVHSGSLGLIYGKQAHYVINVCGLIYFLCSTTYANAARGSKNDLPQLEYNFNCN